MTLDILDPQGIQYTATLLDVSKSSLDFESKKKRGKTDVLTDISERLYISPAQHMYTAMTVRVVVDHISG